ncbi:MAG TPA: formate/nitrite transporter family protein [Candidatus Binatia bacterium]|nr:formate/nitrite transporter family protein [Candidatus Binatia bacterium]
MPGKASSHLEPALAEGPISTRAELKQVEERLAIGANVVYETIRREGEDELNRTPSALAWSSLAAGLSMGFSFIAEGLLMAHLPDRPWRALISRLGYSVGFLIVILGRQQLFTENTLTVVLPLLLSKDRQTFLRLLRLWCIVLAGNLVGTFLFALAIGKFVIFDAHTQECLKQIGAAHMGAPFAVVLVRSIFAGWLIALMVWLLPGAESARVSIIIIITYLIGLGAFNHIIAGSTTVFFMVVNGSVSLAAYFLHFCLPVLIGNMAGGISLVAALGHAQVVGGKEVSSKPAKAKAA